MDAFGVVGIPLFLDQHTVNVKDFEKLEVQSVLVAVDHKDNSKAQNKQTQIILASLKMEFQVPLYLQKTYSESKKIQISLLQFSNVKEANLMIKYSMNVVSDQGPAVNLKVGNCGDDRLLSSSC